MRKELPLVMPPINGLQYIANPLAIILNDEASWAWLFSDYVQLIWYKEEKLLSFYNKYVNEIPTCIPCLEFQCLEKQFVIENMDVIQFMIDAINSGWYIFSSYDEQYIPNTYGYFKKKCWYHDFMMQGYDLDKRVFFFTIYTKRGKYERNVVDFDEFLEGFLNSQSNDFQFNRINLFRRNEEYKFYFDKQELIKQIEGYIESTCEDVKYTVPYWHKEKVYGLDIYDYIIDIFKGGDRSIRDKRMLYILWEHKKCMQMRINYIINHRIIKENVDLVVMFENMEQKAEQLKLLQLKMCVKNDMSLCKKIVIELENMRELDEKSMRYLLKVLKENEASNHK